MGDWSSDVCSSDLIGVDQVADFLVGRPDVLEEHVRAVAVGAERRGFHILGHSALDRIGDDERGRGEEVGAYVGRHAALEIAIARKNAGRDDVVLVDRLRDRGRERPRIADAGRWEEHTSELQSLMRISYAV